MAGKGKEFEMAIRIAGKVDKSMGKALKDVNMMAAASFAAIGTAAIGVTKYAYDLGTKFDSAYDTIRIGTGATGDQLDGLKDSMKSVYAYVPGEMGDAATAIADYNTRLGVTGRTLETLSTQAMQVTDMLDEDMGGVIEYSSKAFQQWGILEEGMADGMDYIFKVAQSTGTGFTTLMTDMQGYGAQLQQMGYGFEDGAVLIGQMEKAGVNVTEVLGAMKKSVTTMAREGMDATEGMEHYYEAIAEATTETEAITIASEVFGSRAASTMAAAIRDGSMSVTDLTASLSASSETIGTAAEDTYDLAEKWDQFKHRMEVKFEPAASAAFDAINKAVETLFPKVEELFSFIGKHKETLAAVAIGIGAGAVAFGIASTAMSIYTAVTAASAAGTFTLAGAVAALNLPLIGITVAIAALVAGGILLYQNWDTVKEKAVELWTGLCAMVTNISGAFAQTFPELSAMLSSWWDSITIIFENIKGVFTGIIDFVKNVFTGNWKGAWQAVQDIFANIVGGWVNIFKIPLNGIIGIVNMAIGGLNSLAIDVPDWVPLIGGQTWGFQIPEIPQLADGGIAISPTISQIGEGGEPEAVLPLSKLATLLEQYTGTKPEPQSDVTGGQFVFAPVQHFSGAVSRKDIEEANAASFTQFKAMMAQYERERRRTALGG